MTDEQGVNIGEIARAVDRIEKTFAEVRKGHHDQMNATTLALGKLSEKFDAYIGPVAVLQKQAADAEVDIKRISDDLDAVTAKSAAISGGIGVLAFLAQFWPWHK
jgi:ABC-type transporter Mla subunit MlaD